MRNVLTLTFTAALLAASAPAQYRGPDGYAGRPDYGRRAPQFETPNRVLGHLEQIRGGGYWEHGDLKRVENARADLFRFREEMERGRYNRGRLDSAIGNLDHLARSSRVPPRDRDWFRRDVVELREFRARGWDRW